MISELDFWRARREENYRQSFLDSVHQQSAFLIKYVEKIVYNEKEHFDFTLGGEVGLIAMETLPCAGSFEWKESTKSVITAYAPCFTPEKFLALDDFLSVLEDHEGYHALVYFHYEDLTPNISASLFYFHFRGLISDEEYQKQIKAIRRQGLSKEIGALQNQLRNLSRRNCSLTFIQDLRLKLENYQMKNQDLDLCSNSFN